MITTVQLPDGTMLRSGTPGQAAITSFTYTAKTCAETELTPGGCCAAMVQLEITGDVPISAGDRLQVYRGELLGVFHVTNLSKNVHKMSLTSYDNILLLDKQLELQNFTPCNLQELAEKVCESCNLILKNEALPCGDFVVPQLQGTATGRQIMQWIGQATGTYCRALPSGEICFQWFQQRDTEIPWVYSSKFESYAVAPVEKVQLASTAEDVGVVWPNLTEQVNTLIIRGNPLLAAEDTATLEPVARQVFDAVSGASYTPCTLELPEETVVAPGDILEFEGSRIFVMTMQLQRGRRIISCTGAAHRDSSSAINQLSYKALSGRVLEMETKVEGLRIENRDSSGKLSKLTMDVEGLSAAVYDQKARDQQRFTQLEQTAEKLALQVQDSVVTSTGYTFDKDGLRIARSGTEMENRLDHSGMYVTRAGETILKANNDGVVATDVRVRNYLHIGLFSRLEDYGGRTACFFTEGIT